MLNFLKKRIYAASIICAFAFVLYYPALFNDYVWDDIIIFVDRDFWREGYSLWYKISQPVLEGTSYFRPLVFLTFAAEFHFFGLKPFVSHFINLLFLLVNIVLLYYLSYKIAAKLNKEKPYIYAFILTLLYAASPILVESTVWAVGRFDLMVTTFILLGIAAYIKLHNGIKKDLILGFIFLLGLFCKELAIVLPLLIFMFAHYFIGTIGFWNGLIKFLEQNLRLILFLGLSFIGYMSIRISTMDVVYHSLNRELSAPLQAIPYIKILLPLNTFYEYFISFLIPFYPNAIHQIDYAFIADWRGKLASIFSIITIGLVIYGVVKKNNFSAYMAFCAILCLLPVMQIMPLSVPETIIHERFMTTALCFVLLAVVFLPWNQIFRKLAIERLKKLILVSVILFYALFSVVGVKLTIPMWKNNLILWKWAYEKNPDSDIALQSYLIHLYEYKKYNDFVKLVNNRRADLTMKSEVLYYAYLLENRDPETKSYIDGMINSLNPLYKIIPNRTEYALNDIRLTELGSIYHLNAYYYVAMGKNLMLALDNINIALWYDPQNKQYKVLKSIVLLGLGNKQKSDFFWQKAIKDVHVSKRDAFDYQRQDIINTMCKEQIVVDRKICKT